MGIQTAAGVRIHIGTTANATTQSEYEADTYTEIGEIEEPGEFGDEFNPVTFASLADRRTRKYKGTKDAGDMAMVVALDAGDAGQIALKSAHEDTSSDDYNIKVTLDDAPTGGTPTTFYYSGKVMSRRIAPGGVDNIIRANISIAINSGILEVDAAEAVA